ncbi:HypC/HybG/HupF family hydrogenase formation chaperone [Pseudomonas nitroreducens]|uniref:HypC/HybG/HupF family hydrogenase formation chaperone n=1 Tax=Pseudomonas nitroreducens TaxID=46680 RepID=UPI002659BCD1|nr:HypC/HybG/HupF family hydrogenase formation chaperone [Pseudomonas nitroreducens]MCP1650255.1 hydrogenase expression/formation protein HypC [Pseudomonas nitroreducens]MCP1687875.1 hydrogenase expression/formation protein HypC [Pseudomonas nitroreducens]
MCIGLPMQVLATRPGAALCSDRHGQQRWIDTTLVDACASGDWLLVFIDAAREHLTAERAAEIDATLALLDAAMLGEQADGQAAFALPSAMSAEHLANLLGQPIPKESP